ncbi:MAG TPA: CotH kinase family protein, partial [bacterium]
FSDDLFDQVYNYPRIQNFPTTFHSFNLNGMAADYSLVRNYLAFRLLQNAGAYAPQVSFTRLFINGDDRGIYIPMERIDKWFVTTRNFPPGDYDIIKTGSAHKCSLTLDNENGAYFELKEGDFIAFSEFITWLNNDDHSFQELAEKIDVASFLYYDLMCRFSNNKDSYDINYYLIKNRDIATSKWMILTWDTDESFGWDSQPNVYWYPYNKVFDQLRQTDDYSFLFRNTLADLINTKWSSAEVSKLVKNMEAVFQTDNPADESVWNEGWYNYASGAIFDFQTDPNYNPLSRYKQFDYIKQWVGERIDYLHNQTWEPDTALLTIAPPIRGNGSIQLNSLLLTVFPWSGAYFREIPIPISAIPDPGYYFIGWSDSTLPQTSEIKLVLHNDYQLAAIFQPDSLHYEIVINEINYNSSSRFDPGDWIELYNPNKDTVDLSGWHLKDVTPDHDFKFPAGSLIAPNGFLIVCQKKRDFHNLFPFVTSYVGDFGFGLSNEGDEVRIVNPLFDLIDSVKYDETHPWPGEANGTGATLELLHSNLDNTVARNWQASAGYGSPGKATLALPVVTRLVAMDSSGSSLVTQSRDVLIDMEGHDFDGDIAKWLISESETLPTLQDFVLTNQPNHYHITGNEGNITLFGWLLDNDNQISRLTDTSRAKILLVLRGDRFLISGKATYLQNQEAIPDMEVRLTESNIIITDTTDGLGSFHFNNLYPGTVRLETIKTGDWRHAISGADALLILYDLANMFKLSKNSLLAADATEDGKITEADVQAILRFLTFDLENGKGTGKWCAIPRDTTYLLNANALSNFQCYLLGDVNLNWGLNDLPGNDSLTSRDSIDIIVQSYDVTVNDKQFVKVPIVL